jgi:hypothetical protein
VEKQKTTAWANRTDTGTYVTTKSKAHAMACKDLTGWPIVIVRVKELEYNPKRGRLPNKRSLVKR